MSGTLILQNPPVPPPESAMLPGMSAPAPRSMPVPPIVDALAGQSPAGITPNIPDTSIGPVALQEVPTWTYDFDPANGLARASFPGEVNATNVGGPTTGTGAIVLQNGPTINGAAVTLAADPTTNLAAATKEYVDNGIAAASGNNVGRNKIDNPLFSIWQRGIGPFTANAYTADRWVLTLNTDSNSLTRIAVSDAMRAQIGDETAQYALADTFAGSAAAAAFSHISQRIEDVTRLSGKTICVSFFAMVASGTISIGVQALQNFGSGGGSATVQTPGIAVPGINPTFSRYSVTFAVPSMAGKTIGPNNNSYTEILLWLSSGSLQAPNAGNIGVQSGIVTLWGIQVEVVQPGATAVPTPLEHLSPPDLLSHCQRFYQIGTAAFSGNAAAASQIWGNSTTLPTTMRAGPVVTDNYTYTNMGAGGHTVYDASSVLFFATSSAAGAMQYTNAWAASADL